ncbi:hypothetical protein AK830_g927 [Neonectria ditissima]|uniref:LysM domain-containing protein n=1 Tax=Neonectria ditissima TaxID=78410 RepID=A0A0P7BNW9_9HYPO|nr:hypothetical protein AK830_g927 [Neonectria ditissima]
MFNLNSLLVLGLMITASTAKPHQAVAPGVLEVRQCNIVTHTVTAGEGLSAIATSSGVGVCNIATANALTDINSIDVGDVLTFNGSGCEAISTGTQCCIPAIAATTHVAVSGDRYWEYHVTRGVNVQAIISANPGFASNGIPIGSAITIPARPSMNC